MNSAKNNSTPSYLKSILAHKCPRCRTGQMFICKNSYDLRNFMKMPIQCPACGQHLELESGFYYGTSYVSYALSVLFSAVTFVAWWVIIGLSTTDNRLFWWMGINVILLLLIQPYLMRFSRVLWLSFFVSYNPWWRTEKAEVPERLVQQHPNTW